MIAGRVFLGLGSSRILPLLTGYPSSLDLSVDQLGMMCVGYHKDLIRITESKAALIHKLKNGLLHFLQTYELLRIGRTAQRPQSGTGSPGENDGFHAHAPAITLLNSTLSVRLLYPVCLRIQLIMGISIDQYSKGPYNIRMKITRDPYGRTQDNKQVDEITLINEHGYSCTLITLGARIISFKGPDKNGRVEELTKCPKDLRAMEDAVSYHGATIGRYANRI